MTSLFSFSAALADDTIYCPPQAQRANACAEKKQFIKQASRILENWEKTADNPHVVLMPWLQMTKDQYQRWTKPSTLRIDDKEWPVFGTYRDSQNNAVYLAVHAGAYFLRATQFAMDQGKPADWPLEEVARGRHNSDRLKQGRLRQKMASLYHERQQAQIFLAQCCGYRWTTEGPGTPRGQASQDSFELPKNMMGISLPNQSNTTVINPP
jgi:hypothetical protein